MTNNSRKEDLKEDEIVDTLLRLTSKNLESRIKRLEEEIQVRNRLSNELLELIGTQQVRLEDKVWRLRYAGSNSHSWERLKDHELDLRKLERMKINEQIASAADISKIRDKLQEAREQFQEELMKLKLVGSLQDEEENKNAKNHEGNQRITEKT